jgi:hypothetical protein
MIKNKEVGARYENWKREDRLLITDVEMKTAMERETDETRKKYALFIRKEDQYNGYFSD